MFDLLAIAFQADVTRVFTFMAMRDISSRAFPQIGVPDPHHALSHEANGRSDDPNQQVKFARVNTHHTALFAKFVERLQGTPDGDGTLLDHSLILYGGGMGDGNLHRHADLPTLSAGKLGGAIKSGYHRNYTLDTPMTNLLLTVLDKVGVNVEKLGDSTGRLPIEPLSV